MHYLSRVHPLILFLLVGAMLFSLDSLRSESRVASQKIAVSQARVDTITASLEKELGQRATDDMVVAGIKAYVDDEILYREALELGLHLNDGVVRRRLAQTMAFVVEGKADMERPREEQLRSLYQQLYGQGVRQLRYSFRHLFFSADRRGVSTQTDAGQARAAIEQGSDPTQYGDPFLTGLVFSSRTLKQIEQEFGTQLAQLVSEANPHSWSWPVASPYGSHLIYINAIYNNPPPSYENVRDQLILDWREKRRKVLLEEVLAMWREKYQVKLPNSLQQGQI